ncbi:MAG: hypothetical protein B7X11_01985 [Acidobacteria bacterium 37-65-4]|nr:MAG: hypothetical protein B7X11_01985 [Acidobacteria bacterium 37-65-4]
MARTLTAMILMLLAIVSFADVAEQSGSIGVSANVVPVLRVQGRSLQAEPTAVATQRAPLGVSGNWTYVHRDLMPATPTCATNPSDRSTSAPGCGATEHIQLTLARL